MKKIKLKIGIALGMVSVILLYYGMTTLSTIIFFFSGLSFANYYIEKN